MADWVEAGSKAPDFTLPADDGQKGEALGPARQAGRALFLSQGRHARLHAARPAPFATARRRWPSWGPRYSASAPTTWPAT